MTYSVGSTVTALDYMAFRGPVGPASAYVSDVAAGNVVAALVGVGFGTRGYGQVSTVLPAKSTGNVILASDWNYLQSAISNINIHTGSSLPIEPTAVGNTVIQAEDGSNGRANIPNIITQLDRNRLNSNSTQMSTTVANTSIRTASWTTSNIVYHEITADFSTEDNARFFFNSGGSIYISAAFTGTNDQFSNAVGSMLAQVGTVQIGSQATTHTGPSGTPSSIGYYNLTTSYQQVFVGTGSGQYSTFSYTVSAMCNNVNGTNGGNGSQIKVKAAVGLGTTGTAIGTLTSTVSNHQAGGVFTINTPAYTKNHGVDQG